MCHMPDGDGEVGAKETDHHRVSIAVLCVAVPASAGAVTASGAANAVDLARSWCQVMGAVC